MLNLISLLLKKKIKIKKKASEIEAFSEIKLFKLYCIHLQK